ncbi:hypothetical protein Psal159_03385 (plasmid) [Piscirickettsia salmonis]|uniref:hypothetical protein n=1 Tax=Piscirickettsia salmonis TaxID=1238 RepID=UPI0006BDB4DB|nr:hypothetical protein [Piscirickettsia salmonis]ALA26628.1 hypothetical protein KW89_3p2 [Piscirickettsia salmonis]QGO82337.1 hypothetical protein Psal107_03388 [Piscirickettsia salmonis]QGP24166.1 hypothetical protein Psal158_03340 [Piscirickettsia salmonis]QGP27592.1 hypothetical protein Psal159_03385 [Piscirickettsia salmonis]QGP30938.1 hypothetical protein Psal160_03348 [Piscirickettsia salmonis]
MDQARYEELCKKWLNRYPKSSVVEKVKILRNESNHILSDCSQNQPSLEVVCKTT